MEEILNEYVLLTSDGRIMGYFDIDTVKEYLDEYNEEKILKYCEEEDLDCEYLSPKKRKEIMDQIGYGVEENKVYKTKKIISEIRKSEMDDDIKTELIERLIDDGDEIYVDEYDGLKEILDEV